jgi:hypothetical protein
MVGQLHTGWAHPAAAEPIGPFVSALDLAFLRRIRGNGVHVLRGEGYVFDMHLNVHVVIVTACDICGDAPRNATNRMRGMKVTMRVSMYRWIGRTEAWTCVSVCAYACTRACVAHLHVRMRVPATACPRVCVCIPHRVIALIHSVRTLALLPSLGSITLACTYLILPIAPQNFG